MERKRIEEEKERKKREELVKQIKELEKQPKKRTHGYDPTETHGFGLYEEMTIIELRERILELQIEKKQQEENKRKEILIAKDEYTKELT